MFYRLVIYLQFIKVEVFLFSSINRRLMRREELSFFTRRRFCSDLELFMLERDSHNRFARVATSILKSTTEDIYREFPISTS